jgi:hypothetical protein
VAQRGRGFLFERLHLSDSLVLRSGELVSTITGTKFERYSDVGAGDGTVICTRTHGFDLDRFVSTDGGWRIIQK